MSHRETPAESARGLYAPELNGMKILLYGINFAPELTGVGKYTGELAESLSQLGHEVRVVTALPYYPRWNVDKRYPRHRYFNELWRNVSVHRAPLYVPEKPGGVKRLLHLSSFAVSSLPLLIAHAAWRPDVIWTVEPALMCAPSAWVAARLFGARCWLHIQDFEIDAAFELGLFRGHRLRQLATAAERFILKRFDRVSTISTQMAELAEMKCPGLKVELAPNWVDTASIRPLASAEKYRRKLDIPQSAVVALYSGNMGGKQGLEMLSTAAQRFKDRSDLYFVFSGNGPARAALESCCADLPNVRFIDLQPLEDLNELLNLADFHLLPQRADAEGLVMPSKLTGMLASGRPVVATANPRSELGRTVHGAGHVTAPGDEDAFCHAIKQLLDSPVDRQRLGAAARAHAEARLSRVAILRTFERSLAALVEPSPAAPTAVTGTRT